MRLFSSLPLILLLLVLWPLMLMTFLFACAWLERNMLVPRSVVPRRLRRMEAARPEQVEAMVLNETADIVASYWQATGITPSGSVPAAEPAAQPARRSTDPRE